MCPFLGRVNHSAKSAVTLCDASVTGVRGNHADHVLSRASATGTDCHVRPSMVGPLDHLDCGYPVRTLPQR